ncbi:MAG TPA: MOSC N-terminal beta barrel domain-containing protein [Terriglobia bacterium]|nr:MOSC N-terminal beta barrel domain-containing protein [Terriglobia bacterium]
MNTLMNTATVKGISLYPIKSLDPVDVESAPVLPSGALAHDREFALFDEQGNVINGKREAKLHQIRARYDLEAFVVTLNDSSRFNLTHECSKIEDWIGNFLERRVSMRRNVQTGFPDDLDSPGPTIVGWETLREVGSWFGIDDPGEAGRRFRSNIVLATQTPFWEDRLFGEPDEIVGFRIGSVTTHGVNPCQRCVVPSREPSTGLVTPDFQRKFAGKRAESLPSWAAMARFNHYYRLAVNTRIPASEAGKVIRTGDEVRI